MNLLKRVFLLILGIFIIACAINLIIISNLGATAWDSANFTLAEYFNITPGLATFITGALLTIIIELLNFKKLTFKKSINVFIVIILGFLSGFFINFTSPFITNFFPEAKILGIVGIFVFAFGINTVSLANLPADPINNFMLKIMEYYNLKISNARIITDLVALTLALSLGFLLWNINIFKHYLGIGTLISFFLLPFSIQLLAKYIFKK